MANLLHTAKEIEVTLLETMQLLWTDFLQHSPYIVASLIFLFITWLMSAIVTKIMSKVLLKTRMRLSLVDLFVRLTSIMIWVGGILVAMMIVFPGVTPAKALGALGLVSVAVGLAFKDIFENFFAGVLILWRFPFENGDFIEFGDTVGKVQKITIRNTLIVTPSDRLVIVPNSIIFKNPITVLTHKPATRQSIITGVAYGESIQEALDVIENALRACKTIIDDKKPEIFPSAFGSSSIDIEVSWWALPTPYELRASKAEVIQKIKEALDGAGIEIPFPYRTLTFKEPLKLENEVS